MPIPISDAFILVGGWAQFGPEAYSATANGAEPKLKAKELIIIAGDTLPPQMDALKAGHSHAQVGQRPFEMGHRAPDVLIQLIKGETVQDPLYTGLGRMHGGQSRQVPGASSRWRAARRSRLKGSPSISAPSRR